MLLNIKLIISHIHILINMLTIFLKKKFIMNMLLRRDNNKELNIKLFKNKLSTNHKFNQLTLLLQNHKMLVNQELLDTVMFINYHNPKFLKYKQLNKLHNMYKCQYNKHFNQLQLSNNHKQYINNHNIFNNQSNIYNKLQFRELFNNQFKLAQYIRSHNNNQLNNQYKVNNKLQVFWKNFYSDFSSLV